MVRIDAQVRDKGVEYNWEQFQAEILGLKNRINDALNILFDSKKNQSPEVKNSLLDIKNYFTDKNIKRTYNIRKINPVNSEYRRESIRYQLPLYGLIEFPYLPSVQMTDGFVPLLLEWYRNSESKNRNVKKKELLDYVNEYYNCIPEYLEKEFLYCSDTEELRIKHFPFIYHLVMSYQNSKRIDDI